eukprot:481486_1
MKLRSRSNRRSNHNQSGRATKISMNEWKQIQPLRLKDQVKCERDGDLITLTSRQMGFPYIAQNGTVHCVFNAKEEHYYFTKPLDVLLSSDARIMEIIPYINKHLNNITEEYYRAITEYIAGIKVQPISEFMVGDFCVLNISNGLVAEQRLVKVQSLHNQSRMFPVQSLNYPVNEIVHMNADPHEYRLVQMVGMRGGAVPNKDLTLLYRAIGHGRPNSWIKQHLVGLLYQQVHVETNAKYLNAKKLHKIGFKNKINSMKAELNRIIIAKHVESQKTIRSIGINEREFKSVVQKQFKECYGYVDWYQTARTHSMKLSNTMMCRIFGSGNVIKDSTYYTYGVDGCVLKFKPLDKCLELVVHVTSVDKQSRVLKGDLMSKKERQKQRRKQSRVLKGDLMSKKERQKQRRK